MILGRSQYQNKTALFTDPIFSDGFDDSIERGHDLHNVGKTILKSNFQDQSIPLIFWLLRPQEQPLYFTVGRCCLSRI